MEPLFDDLEYALLLIHFKIFVLLQKHLTNYKDNETIYLFYTKCVENILRRTLRYITNTLNIFPQCVADMMYYSECNITLDAQYAFFV